MSSGLRLFTTTNVVQLIICVIDRADIRPIARLASQEQLSELDKD
jgi:hypothetical protein